VRKWKRVTALRTVFLSAPTPHHRAGVPFGAAAFSYARKEFDMIILALLGVVLLVALVVVVII
jgi:hypothetical protein